MGCEVLRKGLKVRTKKKNHSSEKFKPSQTTLSLLTAEVQNNLYVSVIGMLLCQGDVGGRGTLGTWICICPQSVSRALQSYQ